MDWSDLTLANLVFNLYIFVYMSPEIVQKSDMFNLFLVFLKLENFWDLHSSSGSLLTQI